MLCLLPTNYSGTSFRFICRTLIWILMVTTFDSRHFLRLFDNRMDCNMEESRLHSLFGLNLEIMRLPSTTVHNKIEQDQIRSTFFFD